MKHKIFFNLGEVRLRYTGIGTWLYIDGYRIHKYGHGAWSQLTVTSATAKIGEAHIGEHPWPEWLYVILKYVYKFFLKIGVRLSTQSVALICSIQGRHFNFFLGAKFFLFSNATGLLKNWKNTTLYM